MNMKPITVLFAVLASVAVLPSLTLSQAATAEGDSTSFDFWVGEWNLTWKDRDSSAARGENTITRIMGGRVLQERFRALSGSMVGYEGMSLSLFDVTAKKWFQTWVDSDGNYLDFTGGAMGKDRFFAREYHEQNGGTVQQRMIFYNIAQDAFDWDWERSSSGSWREA
jgi:hypothetical protein